MAPDSAVDETPLSTGGWRVRFPSESPFKKVQQMRIDPPNRYLTFESGAAYQAFADLAGFEALQLLDFIMYAEDRDHTQVIKHKYAKPGLYENWQLE